MNADDAAPSKSKNQASRDVTLHIERVVIDGVPLTGAQAAQLRAALQGELTNLLERDGAGFLLQGGAMPRSTAPAIQVFAPVRPAELGRQIARSVYASLSNPR
ncbi:MAG: hypothetical protein A3I66_11425 [Burkholderiales bacterium RIFCSPLOWO2_02_FULL_57_36]|nr:MAG: hypothetical protein A3I66_11425 [Burkholderiales bacterium RIFCSPLOWO2_02_FULL_57_36]